MPRHNYLKKKEVATSIASEATTASRSPTTVRKTAVSTSRTAGKARLPSQMELRPRLLWLILLKCMNRIRIRSKVGWY